MGFVLPPGAFRVLLAFAVVAAHITDLNIGRLAVMMFFFLSGFWIADIWAKRFGPSSVGRFYLSRYLRIAPLFVIATGLAVWLRQAPADLNTFNLLGLASRGPHPTPVAWSLDIELQFYLLAPVLLALLTRAPWLTLAGSLPVLAFGYWLHGEHGAFTVLKYLPAFLLGALTFQLDWRPSRRLALISLGAFLAVSAGLAFTPLFWKTAAQGTPRDLYAMIWMLPLLPYMAHSLRIKSSPFDRVLSDLTYPLYLIHPLVIYLAHQYVDGMALKAAAVVVSTLVAAALLGIDRPIDAWRRRVTEGAPAPARRAVGADHA
ncbi:MAG: acyltransferase family protein [Pseudomonadota bacterium]